MVCPCPLKWSSIKAGGFALLPSFIDHFLELCLPKIELDVNGRKSRGSTLGGGLASEGFLQEVTQAESGEHLKWKGRSRHTKRRPGKGHHGQEPYVVARLGPMVLVGRDV